ncbi:hypothetical protein M426DRAFT_190922 [Hypoxylon sp. CI-4A]|nr:hypothetical protein M426DRAFT_190922 [Hypoxylon sp. CI-4A]
MQMLLTLFAFLVTLLGQGIAQDVTIQPCASGCVTGVFNNAAAMGCGQNDNLCVCTKATDYSDGIRDCVNEACANQDAAAQLPLAQSYGVAQCQSASSAAGLLPSATASAEAAPSVSAESVESVPVSADGTIVPSAPTSQATQASQPTQQAAASASVSASSTTAPETTSAPTSSPTSAVQTEAVSADSISDGVLSAAAASESTSSTTSAVVESSTASADVSVSLVSPYQIISLLTFL